MSEFSASIRPDKTEIKLTITKFIVLIIIVAGGGGAWFKILDHENSGHPNISREINQINLKLARIETLLEKQGK